jgi:hypothetical protein
MTFSAKTLSKISLLLSLVSLVMSVVALAPPHRNRKFRRALSKLVMRGWIKSARVARVLHDELWSEGNGMADIGSSDLWSDE